MPLCLVVSRSPFLVTPPRGIPFPSLTSPLAFVCLFFLRSPARPPGRSEQGRESEQLFPYGIYTIPEVSMIGKTEAQLTAEGVSYEVRRDSVTANNNNNTTRDKEVATRIVAVIHR